MDVGSYSTPSFADIDGDIDAVVGSFTGILRTFANNGAGVFSELTGAANPFNGLNGGTTASPEDLVDLDDDGDTDAVVGAEDGTLRSFANDGTGVFTELTGVANPFNGVVVESTARPASPTSTATSTQWWASGPARCAAFSTMVLASSPSRSGAAITPAPIPTSSTEPRPRPRSCRGSWH